MKKLLTTETDFVCRQLVISKQIIENVNPKIIVVNNSLARRLSGREKIEFNGKWISEWINFDFIFDKDLGTDRIISTDHLNNTPVFFTSMLTGQRALDKGSYERLIWQIKFVLEKIENR